jgi:hypothetical protein
MINGEKLIHIPEESATIYKNINRKLYKKNGK